MPLARIGKGIGSVVGLGQEAYQHNKEKKAKVADAPAALDHTTSAITDTDQESVADQPPPYDFEDDDEDLWIEDDAQEYLKPVKSQDDKPKAHSTKQRVAIFVQKHPMPAEISDARLPGPVVLPQRRPGARLRGFVHAYPPDLVSRGVEQDAWLEFVESFHTQTAGHNYFNVANIAVALSVISYTVASATFDPVLHFSAMAVHISIETGRRLYIDKQTNGWLDEMNQQYFQPRGLYAMVMSYRPGSKEDAEVLDIDTFSANAINKYKGDNTAKSQMQSFRASSGKTLESQLPAVCPLVFPTLEHASEEQQGNAFKRAFAFTRDYYDRRAQAEFAAHNPGSKLAVAQKPFAGRYADPTTFENSGLLGVLTNGRIDRGRRKFERRNYMRQQMGRKPIQSGQRRGIVGGVKKVLQEGVLYLMVVDMPSEQQLQEAAAMEAKMKAEQPNWFEKMWQSVT